mmetsp:Transcript_26757/g.61293  ORF Transcript_26757/g.61293 Transcript_26757/m.61293 type:complete len:200 (-) Transcript_26757:916-1515(-)
MTSSSTASSRTRRRHASRACFSCSPAIQRALAHWRHASRGTKYSTISSTKYAANSTTSSSSHHHAARSASLQKHNKLVEATSKIIAEADKLGTPWAIENPACSFGADYQKYTTLLCSSDKPITHPAIQTHRCEHSKHAERLYGNQPNVGCPKTHDAEQYTPKFADALAEAIIQTSTKTNQDDLNQLTYYSDLIPTSTPA